jgi:glycerophosphoryl diester phosphodiesterase
LLADALRAWQRPPGARPFVLGHRGARHAAPENTMAAFELSRTEGADGVELDVRLDGSGQVIVLHDPKLSRVTQGKDTRHAEDIPSRELSRLDVGNGEHIPTLAEVLSWAREHGQRVNVELKSDVRSGVLLLRQVERVITRQALPSVIFSSFHPYFVWWLARRLPDLPRAWLVHKKQHILKYAPGLRRLGANALHPEHVLANSTRVARLKRAHFLVNTWTVNDPTRARELAHIGVDAIISDVPGQILSALSEAAMAVSTP